MHIHELRLASQEIQAQHEFYAGVLGLNVVERMPTMVAFQVGASRLVFQQAGEPLAGVYHFAFNIPSNQFAAAREWLLGRAPLLPSETGQTVFHSESWNADMVYFSDREGNILELIARHTLGSGSDAPFGPSCLLNISEIGISTEDVPAQVAALTAQIGAEVYLSSSATFTPVGDEHGLLIVVQRGRVWFPNTGKPAERVPVQLVVQGQTGPLHLAFA